MNLKAVGALASAEHSKQDMEAREEAVIKAANYYLNKGNGDSNVRSERLLENPLARTEEKLVSTCRLSLNAADGSLGSADQACYPSTFNTSKWMGLIQLQKLVQCCGLVITCVQYACPKFF